MVLLDSLDRYCLSMAAMYYVGLGDPPAEDVETIRKQFYKYCPKCGAKVL